MKGVNYFATFGSNQLEFFELGGVSPLHIGVYLKDGSEDELRERLQEPPFNNRYCTSYPVEKWDKMSRQFNMILVDIDEVAKRYTR